MPRATLITLKKKKILQAFQSKKKCKEIQRKYTEIIL